MKQATYSVNIVVQPPGDDIEYYCERERHWKEIMSGMFTRILEQFPDGSSLVMTVTPEPDDSE
jgi:hypothetical protein